MKKIVLGLVLSFLLTASASAAEFNSNLKYGSRGTEVKKLQEFLIEQDLYSGPITGNFFSLTLKAVKAFQSREHISPVSGFFGVLSRTRANVILDEQLVESDSESVNQPVAIPLPDTSLNDVVSKLNEQNRLLQGSLDLQRAEADRLRALQQAEAARIKAIADAADAAANARQQAEQAARDLAAQQAQNEASRPPTQNTITVIKAGGGTISPDTVVVSNGNSQTFTITPYDEYRVANLIIDGSNVTGLKTHTFTNVQSAHTISAIFLPVSTPSTVPIACANQADLNLRTIMKNGDLNAVKSLVELCSNYLSYLANLLPQAAYYNQTSIALYLLDKNFNPNYSSETISGLGYDPALMYAVQNRNMPLVQALLNKGADVNKKGFGGGNILAASLGSTNYLPELTQLLINNGADINAVVSNPLALMNAAGNSQTTDAMQFLLDKGANVNAKTENGSNALLTAVWNGLTKNVQFLIAAGADVNAQNSNGDTPVSWATQRGYPEIVTLLKQAGAVK